MWMSHPNSTLELDIIKKKTTVLLEFRITGEDIPILKVTPSEWKIIKNLRETIISYVEKHY